MGLSGGITRGNSTPFIYKGISSLLAYLLRSVGHQNVFAICYSPPGCIVTENAVRYFESFCTTVVIGNDIVPRLNRKSVETMKQQVDILVRNCHQPKAQVLARFVGHLFSKNLPSPRIRHRSSCIGGWWFRGLSLVTPRWLYGDLESSRYSPAESQQPFNLETRFSTTSTTTTTSTPAATGDVGGVRIDVGHTQDHASSSSHPVYNVSNEFLGTFLPGRIIHFQRVKANENSANSTSSLLVNPRRSFTTRSTSLNRSTSGAREEGNNVPNTTAATTISQAEREHDREDDYGMVVSNNHLDQGFTYIPILANCKTFTEIIISKSMVIEHIPSHTSSLLKLYE